MVSRFRVEVATLVDEASFESNDAARRALDSMADRVAEKQFARVPEVDDAPIPLNDPRLRTIFRASSALSLPVLYLLMWLGNVSQGLGGRMRVSARRSSWIDQTDQVVGVDVSSLARPERRSATIISVAASGAFLIAVVATWRMGAGAQALQMSMWLAGLVIARRYLFPTGAGRRSYRATIRTMGWARGAVGFALLFGLIWAGAWLIRAGLMGYLFGLPPAEHMAIDPTGAMQLRFSQLLIVLGAVAFAVVPVVYRRLQGAARRRLRSIVELDDRPPVLYLRSFADDGKRVRTKRVARHSLFEYLRPGARDRFDEVVAWALWRRGPVVAIGEPGKPVTAMGAAREYYTDDDWQGAVSRYAAAAPLIAVTVGTSEGVAWELEHLRSRGHLARTIFVLPPASVNDTYTRLDLLHQLVLSDLPDEAVDELARLPVLALRIGEIGEPIVYLGDKMDASEYAAALEQASDEIKIEPPGEREDHAGVETMKPPRPRTSNLLVWAPSAAALLLLLPVWMLAAIPSEDDTAPPDIPLAEVHDLPTCPGVQDLAVMGEPLFVLSVCPRAGVVASTDADGSMELVELRGSIYSVAPLSDDRVVVGDLRSPVLHELSIAPLKLLATHEILDGPSTSLAIVDGRLYATHPATRTVTVLSLDLEVERTIALDAVPRAVVDAGVGGPVLLTSYPPAVGGMPSEAGAQSVLTDQVAAPSSAASIGGRVFVADPGMRRVLRVSSFEDPTEIVTLEVSDVLALDGSLVAASFRAVSAYSPDGELLWQRPAASPILVPFGDDGLAFTDQDPSLEHPHRLRIFESRRLSD